MKKVRCKELVLFIMFIVLSCSRGGNKHLNLYNKGKTYFLNHNLSKAISFFHRSLDKNKKHSPSYLMLGKSYYFSNKKQKAKETFKKLLKVNKNNINALNWLARIEGIDEKKYEKGIKYCNKVLKIDMNNYDAHYYKALIFQQQNKIKEAIIELNNALQVEKIIYLSHLSLGDIYYQKGIKDKAISEYKKVLNYKASKKLKNELKERIKNYEKN